MMIRRRRHRRFIGHGRIACSLRHSLARELMAVLRDSFDALMADGGNGTRDDNPCLTEVYRAYRRLDETGRREARREVHDSDEDRPITELAYLAHGLPLGLSLGGMKLWLDFDTRTTRS